MTGEDSHDTADAADDTDSVDAAGGDDTGGSVVRRERFAGGPARAFLSSLSADERIFAADLAVDRAHVVMLAEQDILTRADAGAILGALADIEAEGHAALPEGEDVHEAIETAVVDRVGPEGGRMHTARSRNDEVAACLRYRLREDVLELLERVLEARERLLGMAREHTETLLPGYTHLQPAQPTTVAHWVCSYEGALARDTDRLLDAYDRIDRSPLGAAAFAGTPFDVDRERTAELLGFDGLVENATDAVSARDFLVETTAATATLAVTLSGLAEDLIVFASKDLVEVDDDYASTSSIMPQKKNPDTLELVRGRTGDATAGLEGLLATLKGLPRAYNRDLQRASGHAWAAVDSVTESVPVAVGAVATADWPEETLASAAGEGFSTATGVADLLAASGMPFRTAHEVVARAAERADDPGVRDLNAAAEDVLGESLTDYVDEAEIEATLDPAESIAARDSRGGPAPGTVETQVRGAAGTLDADRELVAERRRRIEAATDRLHAEVNRYV